MTQKITVAGISYDVLYETAQKRTSSVKIKDGKVLIRLSRFANMAQRDEMIRKFLKWAEKKLKNASQVSDFVLPEFKDGGRIVTHNKIYDLSVRFADVSRNSAKIKDGYLIDLKLRQDYRHEDVKYLSEKLITKDQSQYLHDTIAELNELYFQEKYNELKFKRTSSRFGSCSSKRNINIALKLLFAPREVFRYVCVHELAHLKEMNHSRRFWALVEEAMPEYKLQEKWLREHGFMLG